MAHEQAVTTDLNATIASAVSARVEAEVVAALSGDEFIGRYVHAALTQPVKASRDSYSRETEPYLTHVLRKTIQEATRVACVRLIEEERPKIEEEIRKTLRRNAAKLAETMADSLTEAAGKAYGVKVSLEMPRWDR